MSGLIVDLGFFVGGGAFVSYIASQILFFPAPLKRDTWRSTRAYFYFDRRTPETTERRHLSKRAARATMDRRAVYGRRATD